MVNERTTERRVYFYELLEADGDEAAQDDLGHRIVRGLHQLDRANGEHYQEIDDNMSIAASGGLIDGIATIRLGYVLHSDWPQVERLGDISPLELAENAGLFRAATFVFFERGIVGAEYHWRAPTVARLSPYCSRVLNDIERVKPNLLLKHDTMAQLTKMQTIEKLEFQISETRLAALEAESGRDEPILEAARSLYAATRVETITVQLSHQRYNPRPLPARVLDSIRNLVRQGSIREFDAFKVHGYDTDSGHRIHSISSKTILSTTQLSPK